MSSQLLSNIVTVFVPYMCCNSVSLKQKTRIQTKQQQQQEQQKQMQKNKKKLILSVI